MEKQIQKDVDVNVIKDVLSENGYHWWLLGKVYELLELEEMEKAKFYLQKLLDEEVLVFDDLDSHLQALIKEDYERAFEEWKEFQEEEAEEDMINHPSHYNQEDVETIKVIGSMLPEEEYYGFAMGNVIKYLDRCEYKGDKEQDLLKAQWYAKEAVEFVDDENSEKLLSHLIAGEFDEALEQWKDTRMKTVKALKALNFF